jgi:KipI family sensor histidine kinase inhibitor
MLVFVSMPVPPALRVLPCGDAALTVEFGDTVDPALNARVLGLDDLLAANPLAGVIETIPTYRSLFVRYDPVALDFAALAAALENLAGQAKPRVQAKRRWRVPVIYGGEHGFDLDDVARARGLTTAETIRLHLAGDYRIYMIGFMPGYAYLGGLDPALATPRRAAPRAVTPAGAVMIGGVQAGIQCLASPSGWHVLGRTPVRNFHPTRDPMFLMSPGDAVTFYAVEAREWAALERAAERGAPVAELVAA